MLNFEPICSIWHFQLILSSIGIISKAFDVINHDRSLAKLELYGLRGKIHEWMTYLSNKFQYVDIYYQDHVSSCSKSFTSNLKAASHGHTQVQSFDTKCIILYMY
jgi:hypothetical protein